MGSDWRDTQHRYLIHFAGGGAGMRFYDRRLEPGDAIADGGEPYRIVRVEETTAKVAGFGHAWAELRDGGSGGPLRSRSRLPRSHRR